MDSPPTKTFSPGFRISKTDVCILIVGAIAAAATADVDRWFAMAVAFVVGHFFLFCNILRMSRPPELIWAATFAILAILAAGFQTISWPVVFAASATLTLLLGMLEMRRPRYHGVFWRRINPQLPQWWATHGLPDR